MNAIHWNVSPLALPPPLLPRVGTGLFYLDDARHLFGFCLGLRRAHGGCISLFREFGRACFVRVELCRAGKGVGQGRA